MNCPVCLQPISEEALAYNQSLKLPEGECVHSGLAANYTLEAGMAVHDRKDCVGPPERQLQLLNTAQPVSCTTCLAVAAK